jgi:hypothetical protein
MRRVKHVGEFAVAFNFDLVKFLLKYQAYFVERSFKNHRICLTLLMFYFRWSCLRVKTSLNVDESCVQNIQCHATSKIPQIMSPLKEARLDNLVNKQVIIVFVLYLFCVFIPLTSRLKCETNRTNCKMPVECMNNFTLLWLCEPSCTNTSSSVFRLKSFN